MSDLNKAVLQSLLYLVTHDGELKNKLIREINRCLYFSNPYTSTKTIDTALMELYREACK